MAISRVPVNWINYSHFANRATHQSNNLTQKSFFFCGRGEGVDKQQVSTTKWLIPLYGQNSHSWAEMRDKNISSFVIGKEWGLIGKEETELLVRDVTANVVEKEYLLIEKKRNKLNKMRLPGWDLNKSSNECWQGERNSRNLCDKPHLGQISDGPLCELGA